MELKDIVAVAGLNGLHKIIGQAKNGIILESLMNGQKTVTSLHDRVSVLADVSMYTTVDDMPLSMVFHKIHLAANVPSAKDKPEVQRQYLIDTIQLDSERVYNSDIKKLLTWYEILKNHMDFTAAPISEEKAETAE